MTTDIQHTMGFDLSVSATGDIGTVAGDEAVRERVLRRLLTIAGTYIWQLTYGGGLSQFVGSIANPALIQSIVRGQMLLESSVSRQPLPVVSVSSDAGGIVTANITYSSAVTGSVQQPTIAIGRE